MKEKVLGIIGGMGPEATVELMKRVIRATPIHDEEDHIRMLVDNNPKVPSRMKALIEGSGENPGPYLAQMAHKLEIAGADFLAMPCNTAHYYLEEISSAVNIPILNMVNLSIDAVLKDNSCIKTIGILSSTAVLKTALYEKGFKEKGVLLINPSAVTQEEVLLAIKKIKTGHYGPEVANRIQTAIKELIDRGAEALLIACTELSIVAEQLQTEVKLIDSLQVLSDRIVQEAKLCKEKPLK
jgi:aspartate racemase